MYKVYERGGVFRVGRDKRWSWWVPLGYWGDGFFGFSTREYYHAKTVADELNNKTKQKERYRKAQWHEVL